MKPSKTIVDRSDWARVLSDPRLVWQEKLDGVFDPRAVVVAGQLVQFAGERLRGGEWRAFDVLVVNGEDWRGRSAGERLRALAAYSGAMAGLGLGVAPGPGLASPDEFLASVIARGWEGIVGKRIDATYEEPMMALKRFWEGVCRVSDTGDGRLSVGLEDPASGQYRGRCHVPAWVIDGLRVGDLVKVCGMNLTSLGKIREPKFERVI